MGGRGGISKRIYRTSQNIGIINVFWVTVVRVLSLTGSHSPPRLPKLHSNTVLVSGPAVGAAQILIWSYPSVFLPPLSTAVKTSAFSFVGALSDLLHIPQTQSLPSQSCGYTLPLVQLLARLWVFFLSHTAPGFQSWIYFHLLMWVVHCGLLLRLPWRTSVTPVRARCGGGAAAWLSGTLAASSMQGNGLPPPQELWPYRSLFSRLLSGNQKASSASLSL